MAILFGRVSLEKVSRSPVLCLKYLDLVLVLSSLNKIDLAFLQVDPLELNILETVLSPEDVLSPFGNHGEYLKDMLFTLSIIVHIFTSLVTLEMGSVTTLLASSPCLL